MSVDLRRLQGLVWHEDGRSSLHGELLAAFQRLDRRFCEFAAAEGAEPCLFPNLIAVSAMKRADYFGSFPHLAAFPVTLDPDERNLREFAARNRDDPSRAVQLGTIRAPVTMFAPAACYHVYAGLQDTSLASIHVATGCCACYRNEEQVEPLQRQRCFSMREIVCVGEAAEVRGFLNRVRVRAGEYAASIGLDFDWAIATDPFFAPLAAAKRLAQQLDPTKLELRFEGRLALASVNFHRTFFGEAFAIHRDGANAFSGCAAFGLERWLYALIVRHGADCARWPSL